MELSPNTYKTLIARGAFFFCAVAVLNIIALQLHLYYIIPWFDVLMHFLGGVSVGFVAIALCTKWCGTLSWWHYMGIMLLMVVGWEVFEYVLSVVDIRVWENILDSISDIIMGMGGGLCVWWFGTVGPIMSKTNTQ